MHMYCKMQFIVGKCGGLRPIEWGDWKKVETEPGVMLMASQSMIYYYYCYVMCVTLYLPPVKLALGVARY